MNVHPLNVLQRELQRGYLGQWQWQWPSPGIFFHVAQEVVEVLVHLFILGGILIEESVV
jgi:hypothetical protein